MMLALVRSAVFALAAAVLLSGAPVGWLVALAAWWVG